MSKETGAIWDTDDGTTRCSDPARLATRAGSATFVNVATCSAYAD